MRLRADADGGHHADLLVLAYVCESADEARTHPRYTEDTSTIFEGASTLSAPRDLPRRMRCWRYRRSTGLAAPHPAARTDRSYDSSLDRMRRCATWTRRIRPPRAANTCRVSPVDSYCPCSVRSFPSPSFFTWQIFSDALSLAHFEDLRCDDYMLAMPSAPSSASSAPTADPASAAALTAYVASPHDLVVARPLDADDKVSWLLQQARDTSRDDAEMRRDAPR